MSDIYSTKQLLVTDSGLNERPLRSRTYFEEYQKRGSTPGDISEVFHENTKLAVVNPKFQRSVTEFMTADEEIALATSSQEDRRGLPLVELPEPAEPKLSLGDAVERRRTSRRFARDPIDAEELSTLLAYGCGPVGRTHVELNEGNHCSRGYPSAGAKYPVNLYVVLLDPEGLDPGIYLYSAKHHGLRAIERTDRASLLELVEPASPTWSAEGGLDRVSALLVQTGVFWKTKMKYGPRGYRFVLLEAGHMAQNLQLVATALDRESLSLGGIDETKMDPLLGADGVEESTVYGFLVGTPGTEGADDA